MLAAWLRRGSAQLQLIAGRRAAAGRKQRTTAKRQNRLGKFCDHKIFSFDVRSPLNWQANTMSFAPTAAVLA
jgi:hypothetical protein